MTGCSHPNQELQNFREPNVGDVMDGGSEVGLLADCGQCDDEVLVRMDILETMNWG